MVESTADAKINLVLENVETMVATEGGSLELADLNPPQITVKYHPGTNEECPECVPTHESVERFLTLAFKIHAPQITEINVV